MNIPENILGTLTDEQKKKVEAAQTPEELLAIAKEIGYEMSPDQLEAVAGGNVGWEDPCTFCNNFKGCHSVCYPYYACSFHCIKH